MPGLLKQIVRKSDEVPHKSSVDKRSRLVGYCGVWRPEVAGDALVFLGCAFTDFNGDELESQVIEQLAFVDGDDDLPVVLLRKEADEANELCHMHFVHSLDGVIEDEARDDRFDGEVKRGTGTVLQCSGCPQTASFEAGRWLPRCGGWSPV
ncbi:hypothetical protein [Arthrobacter sp. Br18]|uniref:hypothetical protein n=1 Tax=Arthrobacter sp. Br18 TaxID=1312954 RepID=UPI0012DC8B72|nr:hypothetical protein [Arthrobacter sp. Br18]